MGHFGGATSAWLLKENTLYPGSDGILTAVCSLYTLLRRKCLWFASKMLPYVWCSLGGKNYLVKWTNLISKVIFTVRGVNEKRIYFYRAKKTNIPVFLALLFQLWWFCSKAHTDGVCAKFLTENHRLFSVDSCILTFWTRFHHCLFMGCLWYWAVLLYIP